MVVDAFDGARAHQAIDDARRVVSGPFRQLKEGKGSFSSICLFTTKTGLQVGTDVGFAMT